MTPVIPALRRLHRQRRRAVEAPPEALDDLPPITAEFRTDPEGFQPYSRDPRPSRDRGPPRYAGPRAPRRRPREVRRRRQRLVRPAQPRASWFATAAEKVDAGADDIPPARSGGRLGERCWSSAGARPTGRSRRGAIAQRRTRGTVGRPRPPAPPQSDCRANLGEVLGRFRHVLVPEINSGQLAMLLRARFLRDVVASEQDPGAAVQGDRDRLDGSGFVKSPWGKTR